MKPSCQTTCSKTLQITVFSTHVEAIVQAFLPNNLLQNTLNYSVFEPCNINGPSRPSKQLAPKHGNLQCFPPRLLEWFRFSCQTIAPKHRNLKCFPPMLLQWFKISCQTICAKTPQFTVFSTHVASMAQAFLPNNLPQNTVNYSVFHPCCFIGSRFLAKQFAPRHRNLQCFSPRLKQWFKLSCQKDRSKTL